MAFKRPTGAKTRQRRGALKRELSQMVGGGPKPKKTMPKRAKPKAKRPGRAYPKPKGKLRPAERGKQIQRLLSQLLEQLGE